MERNVVHEKKSLFVASGRGFRRGFFGGRLFENANGLEEPIWKNLPRVFLCECLLIRVSRVRTPDRALNRCFCRHRSCGDGDFLRAATKQRKETGTTEMEREARNRGALRIIEFAVFTTKKNYKGFRED